MRPYMPLTRLCASTPKPYYMVKTLVASWGEFTADSLKLTEIAALRPAALKLIEEVDLDG